MSGDIDFSRWHFIEVEPSKPCDRCGRKKLHEEDKFYRVFVGETDLEWVVCEFCKGGFSTFYFEGSEKTYATHLAAYVKRAVLELASRLPQDISAEMNSAIENYENGRHSESLRCIGFVAEWLTEKLFIKKYGEQKEETSWEAKMGKLLSLSRKSKNSPEEAMLYQLFSLKWFRNKAVHPDRYKINGEDVRLGLISIVYLLHKAYSNNLV
jgi:hypothetical protein